MFTDEVQQANADVYSAELEDLFGSDASKLDEWVFTRVQEMFSSAVGSPLAERMRARGVVFFLHLLGLDTIGHGKKPHSREYIDNIAVVDKGVRSVNALFEHYFHDNRTAFVFTSDHGMTDWGSHGAGTHEEVLTIFVVWGSGVRPSSLKKQINQVDLAPLMSVLLGLPIPVNSIGGLPIDLLDASPKYRFKASYANLKQMLEQFTAKRNEKKSRTSLFFTEFNELRPEALEGIEKEIQRLTEMRRFEAAALVCMRLLERVRAGILYFHRYERRLLGVAVAAAFLSWIWLLFLFCTRNVGYVVDKGSLFTPRPLACAVLATMLLALVAIGMPPLSCVYILLPCYTASIACNVTGISLEKCTAGVKPAVWLYQLHIQPLRLALDVLKRTRDVITIGILLLVLTSVFTHRWLLSIIAVFMALHPHLDANERLRLKIWKRLWSAGCVLLAIFPLLPTVGRTPFPLLCITAPLLFSSVLVWFRRHVGASSLPLLTWAAQLHLLTAFIILAANYFSTDERTQGIVWECFLWLQRAFCWLSIPVSFVIPLYAPSVLLLSLSYESLFLEVFFVLLIVCVRLEYGYLSDEQFLHMPVWTTTAKAHGVDERGKDSFSRWEWSRAVLLVVLIEMAFFGKGNVASLNSFNPSFVRCFVQIFSPFLMTSLLLLKILLPFLSVAFAFVAMLRHRSLPISRLTNVMLVITDAMALVFFMQLTDEGSWLQIGTSISHYAICMAISVFVFALLHLSHLLLSFSVEAFLRGECRHAV
ncbi:unnamed protein product [Toxocara canis]|uniref:GPI ethanolamine phosphate transferase 1 n=1 Tax=Toxocara canis TaxID=6265 RepID=A0A183UZS8_TOXCA|nr:unnamed protein product [Toxocara canis]